MKIKYSHLAQCIIENPGIDELSDRLFQLGHEHEIEANIFDIEFTPNRGDCLSINGLLRDLAVFYTIDLKQKIYTKEIDALSIDFENLSPNICPQVTFLKLEIDVIPKDYNQSLNDYFLDLGITKNNFYTDVSNYLSYETGQPTHCYDASKMAGKFVFHQIDENKDFETLLGKKITLSDKNAVFSLNKEIINLAGVVGGQNTSCSLDTKSVIVECAYFQPEAIIGKSIKYDIKSDASHKFERGVDPYCQEKVLRRFVQIVSEHVSIKDVSLVSFKAKNVPKYKIPIDVKKINQIIGINIDQEEYLSHLLKLDFSVEGNFISVPSFRNDIRTNNDLAEEIARVVGYDNINLQKIDIPNNKNSISNEIENKLRYVLLDLGFYEVINTPFVSHQHKESIKVDNPLDSNREYLRTNIKDSLLDNLLFNEKRQKDSVKLFEISDIYTCNSIQSRKRKISIISSGRMGLNYEDFSKKISVKSITKLFHDVLPSEDFNFKEIDRSNLNTKIKNEIVGCELSLDSFSNEVLNYKSFSKTPDRFIQYVSISDLPESKRDLSFSIKDYSKSKLIENYILNFKDKILKKVFVFDYFYNTKEEEIKIGFRFIFQSQNKTITDEEVDLVIKKITDNTLNYDGISIPGY